MHDQSQQQSLSDRMRSRLNMVVFVASIFTTFAEVTFLRRRFGVRYLQGWKAPLVLPVLLFLPGLFPHHNPWPVLLCIVPFLVMTLRHRLDIGARVRRGDASTHSMYNGISRLERLFPKADEATIKAKHEPALLVLVGIVLLAASPPLGVLLIITGLAASFHTSMLVGYERQRALDLMDARLEGQRLLGASRQADSITIVRIHGGMP